MSASSELEKKLKVVSLEPKVIFTQKSEPEKVTESAAEEVFAAPFFINEEQVIEDLSELVDKVYEEFSGACEKRNLKWEAELELGMEFGLKFAAKLKIAPKSGN